MRRTLALATILLLAGCAAPQEHAGACEVAAPLLVASATVNMADPPAPTWTIVWPDGTTETWKADSTLRPGPAAESTLTAHGGLGAERACGVAAFHGAYPGPHWPPTGFPDLQVAMEVTPTDSGQADAAAIEGLLREAFFDLPADASVPECSDGVTRAYSAQVDGRRHHSSASCEGTPGFEAFVAALAGHLGRP